MKLKLNTSSVPNTPGATPHATPTVQTPGGGGFKLKLKTSQPPTPAEGIPPAAPLGPPTTKPKRPYNKKPKNDDGPSKKRAADDDISPAAKRGGHERKISVKFDGGIRHEDGVPTPTSAKTKISLKRKPSIGPKQIFIKAAKRPPPRPIGVGYDSEASDAEEDPAIEQQFVLRMAPGDDCDYLRQAIEDKKIGLRPEDGGADVSFKFLDKDLRRATVTVRGTKYAACMVELPCIIEGMKSWDKRGWWKVADICQMLLVLGPIRQEQEAKDYPLPREIDKSSFNYAHGLTPPMHWVRKRRFRKRVSYKDVENVDEEVEKLLRDDAAHQRLGGEVEYQVIDANAALAEDEDADADADGDGDFMETTEDAYGQAYEEEEEEEEEEDFDSELAAQLEAGLEEEYTDAAPPVAADAAASLGDVLAGRRDGETPSSATHAPDASAAPTPAAEASSEADDYDEDDDDDDDMDSPDAIDEDALALQAEEAQKREEVADLEREVANKRAELERTTNLLLKTRIKANLKALREELAMKRKAFGMDEGDE